jgi:hypothetical protein
MMGGLDGRISRLEERIEPPKDAAAEIHHKKMIEALGTLARILAQNTDALHSEVAKIQEHHPDMPGVDALVVAKDKVVRATPGGAELLEFLDTTYSPSVRTQGPIAKREWLEGSRAPNEGLSQIVQEE